jgi:hypothetical protein
MIGFIPSTSGERLYDVLVKKFVNNTSDLHGSFLNLENLDIGRRKVDFADYYSGIFCFNLTARLIKAAKFIIEQPELEDSLHHGNMLEFLYNQLEINPFSYDRKYVNSLINLSLEAARTSEQNISSSTKGAVIRECKALYGNLTCYICGCDVFEKNDDPENLILQYEHIWPRSYGGDSAIYNLLPACSICNNAKDCMLLWQDSHVHSFVLKPNPSLEEKTRITRPAKIAKHRQEIFKFACENKTTLKDAAFEIGPYDFQNVKFTDPDDSSDFFTFHF